MADSQGLSLEREPETIANRAQAIHKELIGNFAAINNESNAVLLKRAAGTTKILRFAPVSSRCSTPVPAAEAVA